ncbi:MAG: hypothetical protein WBE46_09690 [Dehalococcoidia bacterium]
MTRAKAKKATHGKQPGGKQAEGKPPKKGLPWFAWLLIALAIAGVVVFVRIYPMGQPSPDNLGKLKAAIVDQLSTFQENEQFIANVTRELEDYGFEVDLYQGDEITVEFYRELPTHGYKLIIFRAHSGILAQDGEVILRTVLFTNEEYSESDYYLEQIYDQLVMGRAGEGCPMMFGITPEFVSAKSVVGQATDMKGRFDDTVIIMMGCSGIYLTDLAQAFVDKGASVYLAWDRSVELYYVDEATLYLIGQLCSEKATIKEAVDSTMHVIGADPEYEAELQYYPSGTGDKTLEELVKMEFDAGDDAGA